MKFEKNIVKNAAVDAIVTALYVTLVANLLTRTENIFGDTSSGKEPLVAMFMLTLLVVSAAITGFAVFGRPVMWHLDGKKTEAISLLSMTIVLLFVFVFLVALVLLAS